MAQIKKIKIWKVCVIALAWNKPPYRPRPLSKKEIDMLFNAI